MLQSSKTLDQIPLEKASVELHQLFRGTQLSSTVLEHPKQVLEQNNLTRYFDFTIMATAAIAAGPINQLLKQRVEDYLRPYQISPPRLADMNQVMTHRDIRILFGIRCRYGDAGAGQSR
ncbi:hypothetical protein V6N11_048692 [Hibiscus sabdariffa]|uniref:Uncharacterized protein n=1 Tax=Hibiscus sabdariffa TaxID=183260 RepID=A0ABR2PVY0_9ROSI